AARAQRRLRRARRRPLPPALAARARRRPQEQRAGVLHREAQALHHSRVIASLKGVVAEKNLSDAVIDVNGVGYRVNLSLLTLSALPEAGQSVSLRIRTVVREDAFELFGFLTRTEEELFLLLTSVSHVGPKVAMNVLSGLEVEELVGAIAKGDVARLTKIHGVGRKTAERLVLELREKVKAIALEAKPGGKPRVIQ